MSEEHTGHETFERTAEVYRYLLPEKEIIHEEREGFCVGCEQFGLPVEWLLAEARGHSDERA
jgi:hypothetical protein